MPSAQADLPRNRWAAQVHTQGIGHFVWGTQLLLTLMFGELLRLSRDTINCSALIAALFHIFVTVLPGQRAADPISRWPWSCQCPEYERDVVASTRESYSGPTVAKLL